MSPLLSELADASAFESPSPLFSAMRAYGASEFTRMGLPSTRNEDWLYTNVSDIAETSYVRPGSSPTIDRTELLPFLFGHPEWPLAVFVNGRFAPALSTLGQLPDGVAMQSLLDAARKQPVALQKHLGKLAPASRDGFTALNASETGHGLYVTVAQEMVSEVPLHLLHVSTVGADPVLIQPHHVFVIEPHAKATVIESFVALGEARNFTNTVSEAFVEDGATLHHLRIQQESQQSFHVGTLEARQGRDSHFVSFSFVSGSALSRSNVYTVLEGEGCGTTLNGLYLLDGRQHGDTQTRVEHVAPRCFSRELYKGLLDGASHGVFNGKVYVHPEAQKTDGKQTNQTLLLSDKARIDTKPQLEIFADDVKCTHGATVGRMDEAALFYLKSRGVGATLARQLLMYAFAADVLETIENEAVRDELERMTLARYTGAPMAQSGVDG